MTPYERATQLLPGLIVSQEALVRARRDVAKELVRIHESGVKTGLVMDKGRETLTMDELSRKLRASIEAPVRPAEPDPGWERRLKE